MCVYVYIYIHIERERESARDIDWQRGAPFRISESFSSMAAMKMPGGSASPPQTSSNTFEIPLAYLT